MFTITTIYVIADIAMILLWCRFAYLKRPHNSVRTMLMFILGIVAIMLELYPGIDIDGKPTAAYLIFAGALHYFSIRRGTDILMLIAHLAVIVPLAILPSVLTDTPYQRMLKTFKYRNEKALSNLIDVSILPPFELDSVYHEPVESEPRLITGNFVFQKPFDQEQYLQNVYLVKQLYVRHMHPTMTSNGMPVYLASEVTQTETGKKTTAASISFNSVGFSVTYGEYTNQIDPVNVHYIEQLMGEKPEYQSIYRYFIYGWDKIKGQEIVLLETPLQEEDMLRMQISCSNNDAWQSEVRNDTTFFTNVKRLNKRTSQTTTFTMVPDQMGGCEVMRVDYLRVSTVL